MINTVLTGEINFKTLNQKGKELKIYPDCRDVAIPGENHKVSILGKSPEYSFLDACQWFQTRDR